jgi:hypothetical protein
MPNRSRGAHAPLDMSVIVNRAEPEPGPGPETAVPKRKRAPARTDAERQADAERKLAVAPMPAAQKKEDAFPHRVTLPLTVDQWNALKQARNEDEIEHSYRVRAAVMLWMEDEKLRARIDKLAKANSDRDRRIRGQRR